MERHLNTETINRRMDSLGLNKAAVAQKLDVSREIVSQWMKNAKFPRPDKLLRLAALLDLNYGDMVITQAFLEPVTAFRKKGNAITKKRHIARARDMGHMLKSLVPCLPFELMSRPASLINPSLEYEYIQRAASEVRKRLGDGISIDFTNLVDFFCELHAVIIPVLWGKKGSHENSLHIYLPDSMTTWVYINLDSSIIDFKFWMAHELGHVKTPVLMGDEAEDFADRFAGALLFPVEQAEEAYEMLDKLSIEREMIEAILDIAEGLLVSPITVLTEINEFAKYHKLKPYVLEAFFPAATKLKKRYGTVSESMFGTEKPLSAHYIDKSSSVFNTPFFDCLAKYIKETGKNHNYIQRIMNIPALDALEIHKALADGSV